jgi:UDP-glucuronate decarboxylase
MISASNPVILEDVEEILAQPLPWERLRNSTFLVSGAGGFLPAYLIETLAALNRQHYGIRILGVVRSRKNALERLGHLLQDGVTLIEHDVSQPLPTGLPAADFIVHAASQASPRFYGTDPVGTLLANTSGTANLLDHARIKSDCKFLFFSSGEIYGSPLDPNQNLKETDIGYLDPATVRACYGESKRVGETMSVAWAHQHGVNATIVRPFHTYGPGMRLDDGRVFADFVSDILARRDIVMKSDGLALRPFCYLSDATWGFFSALLLGRNGLAYNIGNPEAEISIADLAELLAQIYPELELGVTKFADDAPRATGYLQSPIPRSSPDICRAAEHLNWRPTIGLVKGFRRTLKSFDASLS